MAERIEIALKPHLPDARGRAVRASVSAHLGVAADDVRTRDWLVVDAALSAAELELVRAHFTDPVTQVSAVGRLPAGAFDWLVVVGFKPGVTDNVGRTARGLLGLMLGRSLGDDEAVHTSTAYFITGGALDRKGVEKAARGALANSLIETVEIVSRDEWLAGAPEVRVPKFTDSAPPATQKINLALPDAELERISREGTLSLSLAEMRAIRDHFAGEGDSPARRAAGLDARPTDLELETVAQTWSEHCKHKIFAGEIEHTDEHGATTQISSLFKTFIKATTDEVSKHKDWLVSVFHDNAGVVRFNERMDLCFKAETHNSPSALEPFGGAMTGIVGVNRDVLGTGLGAEPLANVWGYCFADPFDKSEMPEGVLHPRRIRDGVHRGVIAGGNESGIPFATGWEFFDPRYACKPMVYCGTVGRLPREVNGKPSAVKSARVGDLVVMVGGRIGKDGIHGATFSSEELHAASPSQAVQIGDPITQKRMGDFLIEARDADLFSSITDNGAGGLSSSVGEMARDTGGASIDLDKAPLKYPGLAPWEIWLSEAQERMTLAVPPEKWDALRALAARREVEVSALGEFTGDGFITLRHEGETVGRLDMKFLHEGCPPLQMRSVWSPPQWAEPEIADNQDIAADLIEMMGRLNIADKSGKWRQYDHEVKGRTVLKPFVGVNRDVPSCATIFLAEHGGREGVVLSRGFNSHFSDVDTYNMAVSVVDEAVRRIIAVGGRSDWISGLDNFCWPDPVESASTPDGAYKMAQLVRACQGLYDACTAYGVPLISGKDSMKNDSTRGGKKISIPPSLLFSAMGRIDDITSAVDLAPKAAGDFVYVLGETYNELGGSEYAHMLAERGGRSNLGRRAPKVRIEAALQLYEDLAGAIREGLVRSVHTPSIGGIAVALAEMAVAGGLGITFDFSEIHYCYEDDTGSIPQLLFSESNSRFIVTVDPAREKEFHARLRGADCCRVGVVTEEPKIVFTGDHGTGSFECDIAELRRARLGTFKGA